MAMLYGQDALQRARLIAGDGSATLASDLERELSEHDGKISYREINSKIFLSYLEAGLEESKFKSWISCHAIIIGVCILMGIAIGNVIPFGIALLIPFFSSLYLKHRASSRARAFEKDYPVLLISLASSIRTGLDPLVALTNSSGLFEKSSEVGKAIVKFASVVDSGVSEQKAIRSFARDIKHPDIELFRIAFALSRSEGSSLGECLHRLARVTRQRQSFRRKIRSAIAMQKLSAWGISGCAIVIGIIQFATNPKALSDAIAHPTGFKILMAGMLLILSGLIWMLTMTKSKV